MNKKEIRKIIINNRRKIKNNKWRQMSLVINKKIFQKFNFKGKKIGIYFPINNEVFLHNFFDLKNNRIYVPTTKNKYIEFYEHFDKYNLIFKNKIWQLKIKKNIAVPEVIFVPLVAFNPDCFRIGYGGGFYDRYLKNKSIIKIGVAFGMQKVDFTPEKHDIRLDYIITEKNIYRKKCSSIFPI